MALAQNEMCLADAVEDWWDTNIEKIKKRLGRERWVNEFENTAHGNSDYLQKAVSNALATKKYDWDTYDIINQITQDDIAEVLANLAYQDLVNDDEWRTTRWDSFEESRCDVYNTSRKKLEARVAKLERLLSKRKNEFIDRFDKPTRSEEVKWVSGLFDKYKSLKSKLKTNLDSVNKQNSDKPFSLILTTNDGNIRFLITTKGNRDEMSCVAFNNGDNAKIDELRRFHLNNGVNEVAAFILQTIKDYTAESLHRHGNRKYEDVSLTTFDCESIRQQVEDLLDDTPEVTVDINDDNADYGFLNIGFFNPEYLTDYDIIAKDVKSFEVERDGKKVGTAKSVEDAVDLLVDKFIKNYINGKYK